jgi:hypothetical protein
MKQRIHVAFAFFWPSFRPKDFQTYFPYVYEKYDLVPSATPEVVFYSAFSPIFKPYSDPRGPIGGIARGSYLRVFLTGENFEPQMDNCDFAISFSMHTNHPNHLRVPLWVYENRSQGYSPEQLIKNMNTDWEKIAVEKRKFCNYVYSHSVDYREEIFTTLNRYKRIDAAGRCSNNMNDWTVPWLPNRLIAKLEFLRQYKFTLALENMAWPGYATEKLVDPMYVNSIPIYVGDPNARESFNVESYIDITSFSSVQRMVEFVRQVDNDRDLYMKMLAAPFYRNNEIPDYAREDKILAFFDRIFEAALAMRPPR